MEAVRWVIVVTVAALSSAAMAGDVDQGRVALAAALKNVKGTLESGLKAGERVGRPISAKFVVEDGTLQLSLLIVKDDGISEFNLYPAIGMINEVVVSIVPELKNGQATAEVTLLARDIFKKVTEKLD